MLKDLPKEKIKLSTYELLIIEARCKGVSFCSMEYDEAKPCIDKVLLNGAAITGAALPITDFFADIISFEVFTFINDFGYGEITLEEVLLALRINSKGGMRMPDGRTLETIQFYGNCFNVAFLAAVLENYNLLRITLERKLQNFIDGYNQ